MILLIILVQCLTIFSIAICIIYKSLFTNLFNLITSVIILAFIPNFLTSLCLKTELINDLSSQILFGITGGIALISTWIILKDQPC